MAEQFDSALGGAENLPSEIKVKLFAESRCQEIISLHNTLEQAPKGGLIFQRLPMSMRRRVMSHNSKRMPKRFKQAHDKQLEKNGAISTSKRPSRKFRRRPINLMSEYNRRQKKHIWLETHIWHAKRFHMIEKWGYKLANSPFAKIYRACYRATSKHCLLQDISYYCCIEIKGPVNEIIRGLSVHVSETCGLTFAAKAYLNGTKEGSVMFFQKNSFPFGAICTVKFLWKHEEHDHRHGRKLWLWVHPLAFNEVLKLLVQTFNLFREEAMDTTSQSYSDEMKKLEAHNIFDPLEVYCNAGKDIVITSLKDKLNRFRLTGPLSVSVLVDALNVPSPAEENKDVILNNDVEILDMEDNELNRTNTKTNENGNLEDENSVNSKTNIHTWWKDYYLSNKQNKAILSEQRNFWSSLRGVYSPAQLPPHQVVALTVLDPRYQLPSKRVKSVPDPVADVNLCSKISSSVSDSPIWCSDIRAQATCGKLSNYELSKVRESSNLVPGFSECEMKSCLTISTGILNSNDPSYIPLILIQHPGSQDSTVKRIGFGSGWDVVIPAGWAMPLWMALIFRGARPGSLKETTSLGFESGAMEHLELYAPDTFIGKIEQENMKEQRRAKYFQKPPNKRPNYIKLGITSPLSCSWDILTRDWSQNKQDPNESFYVLRDRNKLNALKIVVNSRKSDSISSDCWSDRISQFSSLFSNDSQNFLIPVRIESVKKGCPSDCAIICIPNPEDLQSVNSNWEGPVETTHTDDNHDVRKNFKKEHQKHLKHLKRKRICKKKNIQECIDTLLEANKSIAHLLVKKEATVSTKEVVEKYNEDMNLLWIPEPKSVKDSCSRTVVGFVCKGDFSLSESCGVGLGYIPLPALIHLIKSWISKPLVLFRNTHSSQYHFAKLKIC